jgi:hypothetical protein
LELVSVDSTIVRAHQESAGLAVAGETLDALEQALTEEKGAPLPEQPPVLRVMRRRSHPAHPARTARTRPRGRTVAPHGDAERPGQRLPGLADPEAG